MKRVEANDLVALYHMGQCHHSKGEYMKLLLNTGQREKGAELGNAESQFHLAVLYQEGRGVEKDLERELYYLEEAAIAGHPEARIYLQYHDVEMGSADSVGVEQ